MRPKDAIVAAILLWLLWPKREETSEVNLTITEPGFTHLEVEEGGS